MEISPRQWYCFYGFQANKRSWMTDVNIDSISKRREVNFVDVEKYNRVVQKMCERKPIDSTFFDIDVKNRHVMGHEGRHRALAAYDLGIEKIPVTFFLERGVKVHGKRRWQRVPTLEMTTKERKNLNKIVRHCLFSKKYIE